MRAQSPESIVSNEHKFIQWWQHKDNSGCPLSSYWSIDGTSASSSNADPQNPGQSCPNHGWTWGAKLIDGSAWLNTTKNVRKKGAATLRRLDTPAIPDAPCSAPRHMPAVADVSKPPSRQKNFKSLNGAYDESGKDDGACLPSVPLTGPALNVVPAIAWDPAFAIPTCNSGILELQGKVQDPVLLEEPETWPQKLFTKVGSTNMASAPPLSVC